MEARCLEPRRRADGVTPADVICLGAGLVLLQHADHLPSLKRLCFIGSSSSSI